MNDDPDIPLLEDLIEQGNTDQPLPKDSPFPNGELQFEQENAPTETPSPAFFSPASNPLEEEPENNNALTEACIREILQRHTERAYAEITELLSKKDA